MSATQLRFDNRTTRRPGTYSRVDASNLESPASGATGRVLLIGSSEGGAPYSEVTPETVVTFQTSEALRRGLRGGDLKQAGQFAFKPAKEPRITGAQEVIILKVDPDTASAATLTNTYGDAITFSSRDFGPHTSQISVAIAAGTAQGKKVTIAFEGDSQILDNIGGAAMLSLQYTEPPAYGWDTMTALVTSAVVRASGARAELGRDGELANPSTTAALEIVSDNAADVGQTVYIYGIAAGVPVVRSAVLNGVTPVAVTGVFDATGVLGAMLSAACAGSVTVRHVTPLTLFVFGAGDLDRGGARAQGMFCQGGLALVADGASTAQVLIAGRDSTGAVTIEVIALTGAVAVNTVVTNWRSIDFIGLAAVAAARTVTISGTAGETSHAVQDTLIKVRDFFNGLQVTVGATTYGFVATLGTTRVSFDPANLDVTPSASPINVDSPATGSFLADNYLMAEAVTNDAEHASAAVAAAAEGGAADNTVSPIYLSGGSAGTAVFSDWQAALDLARKIDFDTAVCLTGDPAVHAALGELLDYKAGPGRAEADAFVGVMNAGLTGLATKTELKAQIAALNNRNIRVCAEEIDRYDLDGERETFPAYMLAAILAGAQAGMRLGESLNEATLDVLDARGHSSWEESADGEELLEAGLLFTHRVPGKGVRVVRDVTSAVGSENAAFTDGAANRITNFCARELRNAIFEFQRANGFKVARNGIAGEARKKLKGFVSEDKILREWKDLVVSNTLDQAPVSVSLAIDFPTNFIPISIYLYDAPSAG